LDWIVRRAARITSGRESPAAYIAQKDMNRYKKEAILMALMLPAVLLIGWLAAFVIPRLLR
jgi:hypothetical protein